MKNLNDKFRFPFLDTLRGISIVLMIFFHTSFDLNYFSFIQVDIIHGKFWYFLPRLIVFIFFLAVGMSLTIVHKNRIDWQSFNRRLLRLVFFSMAISLSTWYFFPMNWIYFGTLHSIALISLLTLPFLKYEKTALFLALALFVPSAIWDLNIPFWEIANIQSFDYISPFPWIGASFFGVFAASLGVQNIKITNNSITRSLNYLGKHSLLIYIIHQPILFGSILLLSKIKN